MSRQLSIPLGPAPVHKHLPCALNALRLPDKASSCLCAGDDSLIRISEDKLPGDSLALSMGKVWEVIKDQKDLNLPAHKVSLRGHLHLPSGQNMCTSAPWVCCEQPPLQGTWHENVVLVSLGLWLHYWQQQLKLCSPACN